MESSFAEKDLGLLVDNKLNTSHLRAPGAKTVSALPGCIRRSVARRSGKVIHLLITAEAQPLWGSSVQKRATTESPTKACKNI